MTANIPDEDPNMDSSNSISTTPALPALQGSVDLVAGDRSPPPSAELPLAPTTPSKKRTASTLTTAAKRPKHTTTSASPCTKKPQTAEDFNRALLSNPRVHETSALSPDFLTKFFAESRLHHLSSWKTALRAKINALMAEQAVRSGKALKPPREKQERRWVMHVDFDCFFAAVSLVDRPELKDKPVAVTHGNAGSSTSAEIASCNYVARGYGVKNGSWMSAAKELCPELVCLGYEFDKYEKASKHFYQVILSLGADAIQAVSIDEALVDITSLVAPTPVEDVEAEMERAEKAARRVRDKIRERTKCEVSVGVGGNVLLAKLALRKAKPAGQFVLSPRDTQGFLGPLSISTFPGVGRHITQKLHENFGSDTVADVLPLTRTRLQTALGPKTGTRVWEFCRGVDRTAVGDEEPARQSVSVDVNWGIRFYEQSQAETFMRQLVAEVVKRLKADGVVAAGLAVKLAKRAADVPYETEKFLGCGKCDVVNRSHTFGTATDNEEIIARKCVEMLRAAQISPGEMRGMGVAMRGLQTAKGGKGGNTLAQAFAKTAAATRPVAEEKMPAAAEEEETVELDPEVLAALPEDIRAEILKQHGLPAAEPKQEPEPAEEQKTSPGPLVEQIAASEPLMDGREIPPSADFDIDAWNELPVEFREQIRAEHEAAAAAAALSSAPAQTAVHEAGVQAGKVPRDGRQEERRETPPSAEWDITAWNELPEDMRRMLRREHEESQRAGRAAEKGRQPAPTSTARKSGGKPADKAQQGRKEMWKRFLGEK